jgi:hypothetical protein
VAATSPASHDDSVHSVCALAHARVGQWARYRMAGEFEQRLEVVEVDEDEVRLRLEMWLKGRSAGLPTIREETTDVDWALRAAKQKKADIVARPTTLTVAGKTWKTRLTIARWRFEHVNYEQRTWTAADGPIYGVVKMLLTADETLAASMELVAFGSSDR